MPTRAKDIDAIRDLVHRQDTAKRARADWSSMGPPLEEVTAERQVVTYLGDNTTVADLTKHVEALEAEAKERIERERVEKEAREHKARIWRVLRAGEKLAKGEEPTEYTYVNRYATDKDGRYRFDPDLYVQDCKRLEEELTPKDDDAH